MNRKAILGISAFYHDSAAALLIDGEIIAAAQEERFSRIKHDSSFPHLAIRYVLEESGIAFSDIDVIVFYDKPLLKFERLLESFHAFAPYGVTNFLKSIPIWIKEKLFMKRLLRRKLAQFGTINSLLFTEHHLAHAASAYFPSPYNDAAILSVDGVGEWATTTICVGRSSTISVLRELHFPHSVGLLYSSFTHYLGFKVNGGEYKLMGLASYGHSHSSRTKYLLEKIREEIVDIREDGSILLNMKYFNFATKLTMTHDQNWESLLGISRRRPESEITQAHMDLALAAQITAETIVLLLVKTVKQITNDKNLVMAGGVALNCVINGKILDSQIFENLWIQPAAGDCGGALGAAYAAHYIHFKNERKLSLHNDSMKNGYLGPQYSKIDIGRVLTGYDASYTYFKDFNELSALVSQKIAAGKIVGWFQGRMEFGPRALGNRSILADPLNPETQKTLNLKVKYREEFRPFAPSVLIEDYKNYFSIESPSPYMLLVAPLKKEFQKPEPHGYVNFDLYSRLYHLRSDIPAVTHVDYTARIQTVSEQSNPRFWQLIRDFKDITGYGILVNTSFNIRGDPMVCSPKDAYVDFMKTGMDYLVMENYLLEKRNQNRKF